MKALGTVGGGVLFAALLATMADASVARAEEGRATEPSRIVIAGGALAEIAFALGAADRIVGRDTTATHPPEVEALPDIGYVRRLSPEGVLSLSPDLLIAAHDAGPAIALERLRAAGVPVETAPDVDGADAIAPRIRFVGRALGREDAAEALAGAVEDDLAAIAAKIARLDDRPRVLFVLSVRDGAPIVGGEGTVADAMIRLAGGENAAAGLEDWKPMNAEGVIAAQPDVVLMMDGHAGRVGGAEVVLARPEFAATPAGREGRAVTMDGLLLLGFGPRTPQAIAELARLLHPETAAAAGL